MEAETAVREFADGQSQATATVLRFANGLGPDLRTSHTTLFDRGVVPVLLGFDPRYQFVHPDDIAGCLEHAVRNDLDGVYNCAADGVLVLSEIIDLLGKRALPILPPLGTGLAVGALRRAGVHLPPEMLNQLRFGRGLDNRKLKATGYRYRYTTRETVLKLREHQRVASLRRRSGESYRYEEEVEEFLRYSPSVRPLERDAGHRLVNVPAGRDDAAMAQGGGVSAYADLRDEEVVALLPSLDGEDLHELREHERSNAGRTGVLRAIDSILERRHQ